MLTAHDTIVFANIIFCYAFFEFFLKRVFRGFYVARGSGFSAAVKKAASLLVALLIGTSGFVSPALVLAFIGVACLYALADGRIETKSHGRYARKSLEYYVLKQVVMGILLYAAWRVTLPLTVFHWYTTIEADVLNAFGEGTGVLREKMTLILAVGAAFLFVIDGGTSIVRGLLGKFQGLYTRVVQRLNAETDSLSPLKSGDMKSAPNDAETIPPADPPRAVASPGDGEENVGEWIGILERIIALTFVLTGNFTALAFVLTVKSIARFKELEQSKDFAEYYILGTSASMIVALGAGMAVRLMFDL